jgi:hypothetical protein
MSTCFIRVLCRITGIARLDGVIHSTDPIFASGYKLCCRHVFHTWAFRMTNMRDKDTLHSNGGCPRFDAVHAAAWRMDFVSIVNDKVLNSGLRKIATSFFPRLRSYSGGYSGLLQIVIYYQTMTNTSIRWKNIVISKYHKNKICV